MVFIGLFIVETFAIRMILANSSVEDRFIGNYEDRVGLLQVIISFGIDTLGQNRLESEPVDPIALQCDFGRHTRVAECRGYLGIF